MYLLRNELERAESAEPYDMGAHGDVITKINNLNHQWFKTLNMRHWIKNILCVAAILFVLYLILMFLVCIVPRSGAAQGTTKQRHGNAGHRGAQQSKGIAVQCPALLIQNISNPQQVLGWPEMDINCFCCPGIGVAEAGADELDRYAFFIQDCAEIVAERVWSEPRYPGVFGKFFTEAVQAAS